MSMSSARVAQMASSHGPLSRTNTTPVFPHATSGVPNLTQAMSHNSRVSQLSGSTAFTTPHSSLSSMSSAATFVPKSSTPVNGGSVVATNNIINQKADASKSLYQICVNLRQRLAQVPGFEAHFSDLVEDYEEETDPVSALWRCLRKGTPLMTIYNTVQPAEPLVLDKKAAELKTEQKKAQVATFKFVKACLEDLNFAPGECFVLSDLFGDDTTGFVKVTQVINIVLDVAEQRGFLSTKATEEEPTSTAPGSQMSYRDHVVKELVDTERKYVQDLENLHDLKKVIEQKGVIPGDVVHDIFLNINAILDFQRRFLIKIETTNSQPSNKQEWGLPFTNYEEAFDIYQPFIANQRKAASIAQREFDKIALAEHPVVVDFNTLDGFLLKPMQRLVKYPLLLKDLRDKTGADDQTKADLSAGIEAANRVLSKANDAVDREIRNEALTDLCSRVDDWKNHRVDHFGDLLLHGHYPVVTGKTDVQKEYTIYLFERILLCCKEVNPNKSKDKLMGTQKDKKDKKDKKGKAGDKNAKLQLKGRIFMTNVTEVLSLGRQGSYTVQIFWKGDPGVENFIIRFKYEEEMKKWYNGVDGQRKEHAMTVANSAGSPDAPPTEFAWMRDQTAAMPNPYAQEEDDDEEEYMQVPGYSTFNPSIPRNASTNSLRSRSTTGESTQSLAGIARAPPPRFPMGSMAPLSLQTQLVGQLPSPGQRGGPGESYFSPVVESPVSTMRASVQSQNFPFPRQGTPQGWEDNNRYTAPARAPSRESQTSVNAYQVNGRTPQRPSLPAMASQNAQQSAAQQRSRSYSTPDINNQNGPRRLPNGAVSGSGPVPAVPGIPAHLVYEQGVPRSQNASPVGMPLRTSTQSPGVQRERLAQQQHYAPQYARTNTIDNRTMSPPLGSAMSADSDMALPTQLKVKVNCDGNYVTLVVAFNITYQSLIDRIDAKVGRFSNNAIARGTMRLRYRDEDGDFVTIESDDDIQIAFQEWREAQKLQYHNGQLGEIELFCLSTDH